MPKADKRARKRQNQQMARMERETAQKRSRRRRLIKQGVIVAVSVVALVFVVSRFGGDDKKKAAKKPAAVPTTLTTIDPAKTYVATIDTNFGTIKVKLDPKKSPKATNHFVQLVKSHFYDGLTWHRVAKDFMIQGGDPQGDGLGVPRSSVVGEVPKNHYPVGSLAAAKTSSDPAGTFGNQIFIVTGTGGAKLANDYARWGSVISGLDVAKKIEALAPTTNKGDGNPTKPAKIVKITVANQ